MEKNLTASFDDALNLPKLKNPTEYKLQINNLHISYIKATK